MKPYVCYVVEPAHRQRLLELSGLRTSFSTEKLHHITERYGTDDPRHLHNCQEAIITGHVSDGEGIEAFLVTVNGRPQRPDGAYYHLTHSFDAQGIVRPSLKIAAAENEKYDDVHAKTLSTLFHEKGQGHVPWLVYQPVKPFPIPVIPGRMVVQENTRTFVPV